MSLGNVSFWDYHRVEKYCDLVQTCFLKNLVSSSGDASLHITNVYTTTDIFPDT